MINPARRRFLQLSVAGVFAFSVLGFFVYRGFRGGRLSPELRKVAAQLDLPPLPNAGVIAKEYLGKFPAESRPEVLQQALFGGMDITDAEPQAIHDAVTTAISNDYDNDNTVLIRGWVLSRTEARLCVLSAIAS